MNILIRSEMKAVKGMLKQMCIGLLIYNMLVVMFVAMFIVVKIK